MKLSNKCIFLDCARNLVVSWPKLIDDDLESNSFLAEAIAFQ